ncbi:MAG: DUF1800 family protein, partial [Synechocystis sp.]|nr:DUF1800 family protein [Synechocystis sp.]
MPTSSDRLTLHILNRLSYGPKPGDLDQIQAIGIDAYIQGQLTPHTVALPHDLSRRIAQLPDFQESPAALRQKYARNPNRQGNAMAEMKQKPPRPQALDSAIAARIWRA